MKMISRMCRVADSLCPSLNAKNIWASSRDPPPPLPLLPLLFVLGLLCCFFDFVVSWHSLCCCSSFFDLVCVCVGLPLGCSFQPIAKHSAIQVSRKPSAKILLPPLASLPDPQESISVRSSVNPAFHFNNVPFLKARRRFFSQLDDLTLLFYQQEPLPPMRGSSFCGLMPPTHPVRVFLYRSVCLFCRLWCCCCLFLFFCCPLVFVDVMCDA